MSSRLYGCLTFIEENLSTREKLAKLTRFKKKYSDGKRAWQLYKFKPRLYFLHWYILPSYARIFVFYQSTFFGAWKFYFIPTVSFRERVLKSKDNKYYILNSFRFYPRWRDWEMQQAMELDYTLDETQLAEDWASLLTLASQPGSSLEQLHIFVLAHVLRRPIIIYGVKYVKSWRGENLGYARFEGKTFSSNVLDWLFSLVNTIFKGPTQSLPWLVWSFLLSCENYHSYLCEDIK